MSKSTHNFGFHLQSLNLIELSNESFDGEAYFSPVKLIITLFPERILSVVGNTSMKVSYVDCASNSSRIKTRLWNIDDNSRLELITQ